MATFRAPSVVPGALDAFTAAYDRARARESTERSAAIGDALNTARLQEAMAASADRGALAGDLAEVHARFGAAPSPAAPSVVPSIAPAPAMAGMPEQLAGPPLGVAAAGTGEIAPTTSLDPSTGGGAPATAPPGFSHSMAVAGLGADRVARLLGSPRGVAALQAAGYMSNVDFDKRERRTKAKEEAAKMRAEAQRLYTSGDPENVAKAFFLRAAAARTMAQVTDRPDALIARADADDDRGVKLMQDKRERELAARDYPPFFAGLRAYKMSMRDPRADHAAASEQFHTMLSTLESADVRRDAEVIVRKMAAGEIEAATPSPMAALDRRVAETRLRWRDQGRAIRTEQDTIALYQEAIQDPVAYAEALDYISRNGKSVPKWLLKAMRLPLDTPSNVWEFAIDVAEQISGHPQGSKAWSDAVVNIVRRADPRFEAEQGRRDRFDARGDDRARSEWNKTRRQMQERIRDLEKAKGATYRADEKDEVQRKIDDVQAQLIEHDQAGARDGFLAQTVADAPAARLADPERARKRARELAAKPEMQKLAPEERKRRILDQLRKEGYPDALGQ